VSIYGRQGVWGFPVSTTSSGLKKVVGDFDIFENFLKNFENPVLKLKNGF